MARLIYAKALTKRTDRYAPYISDTVRKELRYVPTVDAVEVVRCRDCWYSSVIPEEMQNVGEWHCEYWCAEMHEDDFCSCGKRREDGKTD